MAVVIWALLLVIVALLYFYFSHTYSYWERLGVPHERPIPPLGNMWGIGRTKSFHDLWRIYYEKFKGQAPFAGLYMTTKPTALILDLDLIKNILIKDFANFHDRGIFNNVRDDPLTGHLFVLQGEQWKAMRQKLTPVFTSGKMKYMFPTVVKVSDQLVSACDRFKTQSGDIDVKALCARFTMDVIGCVAFGIECNSLHNQITDFREMAGKFFKHPRHSPAVQAFMISNPNIARRLRMKFISDDVSNFFLNVVKNTVQYRQENNVKRNDFMDMLIEMKAKTDEDAAKSRDGIDLTYGLTIEQLAAQSFVFFVAGFDTSSTTMAFCLYELAQHQNIQDKLRADIEAKLAQHKGELSYDCVAEMEYLEMVISETLRKHPLVANILRDTVKDYPVPNSNLTIEAGVKVVIPVSGIHVDPDLYPDPEKFIPERFTAKAIQERHAAAYLPFGIGPRHCIGMRFGKLQAKIGLINLLRHYRFTVSENTEIPMQYDKRPLILSVKHGITLGIERISNIN